MSGDDPEIFFTGNAADGIIDIRDGGTVGLDKFKQGIKALINAV